METTCGCALRDLFGGQSDVGACGERDDLEFSGMGGDDVEGLAADRASAAEDGDSFHLFARIIL